MALLLRWGPVVLAVAEPVKRHDSASHFVTTRLRLLVVDGDAAIRHYSCRRVH